MVPLHDMWPRPPGHVTIHVAPVAVYTTRGWVRADTIVRVYADINMEVVKIRCVPGVFVSDPVVKFDMDDPDIPRLVTERADMLALALWGVSRGR